MTTPKNCDLTTETVTLVGGIKHVEPITNPILRAIRDEEKYHANLRHKPSSALKERLAQYTKIAQEHRAIALAHSDKIEQVTNALDISSCGRYASLRDDHLRLLDRCNRRSCPSCALIKGSKLTRQVEKAFDQLRYQFVDDAHETLPAHRRMIAIKVTLNSGEGCTLDKIKSRLQSLHKIWARLLKTRRIADHLIGALRATEITQVKDSASHANPHIHALLLMKSSTNISEIDDAIRSYWSLAIKKEVIRSEGNRNHSTVKSVGTIAYPDSQSILDTIGWVRYITKGSYDFNKEAHRTDHALTTFNYWIAVDQATKGMRMISASGELKDALALVKEHEANERAAVPAELPTRNDATHIWSSPRGRYIRISEATSSDISYTPLTQKMSYMTPAPLFGIIAKQEIQDHLDSLRQRKIDQMRERLLSNKDYVTLSILNELFISNTRYDTEDRSSDRFEADEVVRSSLVKRLEERKLAENVDQGSDRDDEEKSS